MSQALGTPELPTTLPMTAESPLESGSGEVVDTVDWVAVSDANVGEVEDSPLQEIEEEIEEVVEEVQESQVVEAPVETVAAPVAPVVPPVVPPIPPIPPIDPAIEEARYLGEFEKLYAISEDDAAALQTEPELVLPKLAAKMHLSITRDVMAGLTSQLPVMMQHMSQATAAEQNARQLFYQTNPDLNKPEYEQAIFEFGALFRKVNPNADAETAVRRIGDMTRQAFGLNNSQPGNATTPAVPQPAPVKIVPFSPARGGGNGAAAKPLSEWEKIALSDED